MVGEGVVMLGEQHAMTENLDVSEQLEGEGVVALHEQCVMTLNLDFSKSYGQFLANRKK